MSSKDFKLPIFGVGPLYVVLCLILTILGLILHFKGLITFGEFNGSKLIFKVAGVIFILFGAYLWIAAVIVKKINTSVMEKKLITDGVYAIVRNPVYTAFLFVFTGILLFTANIILLILPCVFWLFLTVLMKMTEEKWLRNAFGKEYDIYCSEVNRVIPWFKKNKF